MEKIFAVKAQIHLSAAVRKFISIGMSAEFNHATDPSPIHHYERLLKRQEACSRSCRDGRTCGFSLFQTSIWPESFSFADLTYLRHSDFGTQTDASSYRRCLSLPLRHRISTIAGSTDGERVHYLDGSSDPYRPQSRKTSAEKTGRNPSRSSAFHAIDVDRIAENLPTIFTFSIRSNDLWCSAEIAYRLDAATRYGAGFPASVQRRQSVDRDGPSQYRSAVHVEPARYQPAGVLAGCGKLDLGYDTPTIDTKTQAIVDRSRGG
nr:hypothetical protein [Agrobacterium sp. Ap1]